jgi:hypothetical protein
VTRDEGATSAGLSADEAAILGEFGYDSRYVAKFARRRDGPRRLAEMVPLARAGLLPFRETPSPVSIASYRRPPAGSAALRGCLLSWLALVVVAALVVVLSVGAVVLLSRVQGERGAYYGTMMPWWAAALLVAVPLAVLDALARWRGPRAVWGEAGEHAGLLPSLLGLRPVPPGVQELACLPLLTLIPLCVAQQNARVPVIVPLELAAVLLLGACALTMVLIGGLVPVVALVAAWAGWAWIALRGPSGWATLALLGVTVVIGVPYCARMVRRVNGG